jgi:hypothetical protein
MEFWIPVVVGALFVLGLFLSMISSPPPMRR